MNLRVEPSKLEELVALGAVESEVFASAFFPKTARQKSPEFHQEIWGALEDNTKRLVNVQVFRGGAKTSLLRMFVAKRVAYALSRTIVYVGKSEDHAKRSVKWLRRQIEVNHGFRTAFGLRKGYPWNDTEIQIIHDGFRDKQNNPIAITVLALGITGSTRGVNIDDYRPDLIVIDDPIDEENAATVMQREKIDGLIDGSLKESLAPASEAPNAKIALLQTPLNKDDASTRKFKPEEIEWHSIRFGCWTEQTKDLPLDERESIWPERWPSEVKRQEKIAAMARNKTSVWTRENECRIIAPEDSAFREEWLRFYEAEELPSSMMTVYAIDPVPKPSAVQIEKGLHRKDYEAHVKVGFSGGNYYLLDYRVNRGHDPDWSVATLFSLASKPPRPLRVVVESTAYQSTLAWLIRKAMISQGKYIAVEEITDRRAKFDRIVGNLNGPASFNRFFVKKEHSEFISAFVDYPAVEHDDLLDATAMAVQSLTNTDLGESAYMMEDESRIPELRLQRGCP